MTEQIYLEYRDDKAEKFWEVTVEGVELVRRWGKIGTKGQSRSKKFDSNKSAQTAAQMLSKEKARKGYQRGHPDPEINAKIARTREIRASLGTTDNLSFPFPARPKGFKWKEYVNLLLEARDIEREISEIVGESRLPKTPTKRWKTFYRPNVKQRGKIDVEAINIPEQSKTILKRLTSINKSKGILFVDVLIDIATIYLVLKHRNAGKIEEIRNSNWKRLDAIQLRSSNSDSLVEFKELFGVNVPDWILELTHYLSEMNILHPFSMCLANGFEDLDFGIFRSVIYGRNPEIADLQRLRFPHHPLNYFAIAQQPASSFTRGLVFDYNENLFSPYGFNENFELGFEGCTWDTVVYSLIDTISPDDPLPDIKEFESYEELEQLLKNDRDAYNLITWFFELVTIGYLNFHDKPRLNKSLRESIRYGLDSGVANQSLVKSGGLLSAAMDYDIFQPTYPVRIAQNFHPAFTDSTLSALIRACFYYRFQDQVTRFVELAREGSSDLLSIMGLDPQRLSGEDSESHFYQSIGKFCETELALGRPYLAFLVGIAIWNGYAPGWRKLSSTLLSKVPDEICHPLLKLVAKANC